VCEKKTKQKNYQKLLFLVFIAQFNHTNELKQQTPKYKQVKTHQKIKIIKKARKVFLVCVGK
jgi:hypothetical protein